MRRLVVLLVVVLALPAVATADGVTLARAKLAARQAASAFVSVKPGIRAPISRWTASCTGMPVRRTCHVTYAPKHCSGTVTVSGKGGYVTIRGTTRIACRG